MSEYDGWIEYDGCTKEEVSQLLDERQRVYYKPSTSEGGQFQNISGAEWLDTLPNREGVPVRIKITDNAPWHPYVDVQVYR